jgi:hypothetical protein
MEGVEPNTVWTWNAIGKQSGAWGLKPDADESQKGFLMNHLISELLPPKNDEMEITNSDPITGQAAWYDLKVKIYPAKEGEEGSDPQFATIKPIPNATTPEHVKQHKGQDVGRYQTHEAVNLKRPLGDILTRGKK